MYKLSYIREPRELIHIDTEGGQILFRHVPIDLAHEGMTAFRRSRFDCRNHVQRRTDQTRRLHASLIAVRLNTIADRDDVPGGDEPGDVVGACCCPGSSGPVGPILPVCAAIGLTFEVAPAPPLPGGSIGSLNCVPSRRAKKKKQSRRCSFQHRPAAEVAVHRAKAFKLRSTASTEQFHRGLEPFACVNFC